MHSIYKGFVLSFVSFRSSQTMCWSWDYIRVTLRLLLPVLSSLKYDYYCHCRSGLFLFIVRLCAVLLIKNSSDVSSCSWGIRKCLWDRGAKLGEKRSQRDLWRLNTCQAWIILSVWIRDSSLQDKLSWASQDRLHFCSSNALFKHSKIWAEQSEHIVM